MLDNRNYLTPEEFAKRISVHPQSVRLWLREGSLRGIKLGRIWRISETEAQRFLALPADTSAVAVAR